MKTLKVVLLLVVFMLTVSGSSKIEGNVNADTIQKIDKDEFKQLVLDCGKKKKPGNNI